MKPIIIIGAVVGLTMLGLDLVARSKGLTLGQYLGSLWEVVEGEIERSRQKKIMTSPLALWHEAHES